MGGFLGDILGGEKDAVKPYEINNSAFVNRTSTADAGTARRLGSEYERNQRSSFTDQQNARKSQLGLAQALEAAARGEGPSVAQDQLRAATDRNVALARGAAASAPGVNAATALRLTQNNLANTQQQAARDASVLRAQEQIQARGELGNQLSTIRSGDQAAGSMAAQAGAVERGRAADLAERDRQAAISREQLNVQQRIGLAGPAVNKRQGDMGFIGGLISSGAQAMSDKKTKVEAGTKGFAEALASSMKPSGDSALAKGYSRGMAIGESLAKALSDEETKQETQGETVEVPDGAIPSLAPAQTLSAPEVESVEVEGDSGLERIPTSQMGSPNVPTASVPSMSPLLSNFISQASGGGGGGGGIDPSAIAGIAAMFSDKRTKDEEDSTGSKDIKAFLDALNAHKYEYKPEYKDAPLAGEGTYVSPMAQELEKTELGKSMVKEAPTGEKVVDYGKGFGAILAAQAELNKRLSKLEKKK